MEYNRFDSFPFDFVNRTEINSAENQKKNGLYNPIPGNLKRVRNANLSVQSFQSPTAIGNMVMSGWNFLRRLSERPAYLSI